jgi:hypothetical protein
MRWKRCDRERFLTGKEKVTMAYNEVEISGKRIIMHILNY